MSEFTDRLTKLSSDQVKRACRELARAGARGGGSYFVAFDGVELPAKLVLREAYRLAYGEEIPSSKFSGGTYTERILTALGFKVVVRDSAKPAERS
jgi:hypothetical protein